MNTPPKISTVYYCGECTQGFHDKGNSVTEELLLQGETCLHQPLEQAREGPLAYRWFR
jgi:hypothetical protein